VKLDGKELDKRYRELIRQRLAVLQEDFPSLTFDRPSQQAALVALVASERAAAVAEERAECLKIADEWVRLEGGFHKLASESRDVQRASDFDEGKAVAEHIAAEIRGRA